MGHRIVTMADIQLHPHHSLSPRDYIYDVGETVVFEERDHVVVRQQDNDLWLALVDYVPGSKTLFSCSVPTSLTTTIFAVRRPKGKR